MADNHDGMEVEGASNQLRSSEPDLTIVLGSGDTSSIQRVHSQTLASKSKYIDAMLSTPMREQESRVISFPDITPEIWASMMKFLDNPIAARQMKAADALDVAIFYDKYEFEAGAGLCEQVVLEYFDSLKEMEKNYTLDLDMVIDLATVAHQANLDAAFKQGIHYLWLSMMTGVKPYVRAMFSEEHIKKLLPILRYSKDSQMSEHYSEANFQLGNDIKLEQPDFPIRFVSACQKMEYEDILWDCISHIELSGSNCNADGDYNYAGGGDYSAIHREGTWGDDTVTFRIMHHLVEDEEDFKGWAIVRCYPTTRVDEDGLPDEDSIVKKKCWVAPYSNNRKFPPFKGWVPSDPLARGNPTIRYVLTESVDF